MAKAQMEAAGMKPVAEGSVPTLAEVIKEQAEKTGKIPRVEEAVEK